MVLLYNKRIASIIIGAILFVTPNTAMAGSQTGQVRYFSADRTFGTGVVTLDFASDQAVNKPACALGPDKRWALNVGDNNAANQYIYSGILAAMASGWSVHVVGTNICTTVSYLEDVAYIEVRK